MAYPCITDAWGVEPKAGPAGQIGDSRCMKDRKIDAGEPGGSEPPRRLSGRRCVCVTRRRNASAVDGVLGDAAAGEGDDASGRRFSRFSLRRNGAARPWRFPVGFANNYCYLDLYRPGHLNSVLLLLNIISIPEIHRTSVPE